MNILETIISKKKQEVSSRKQATPVQKLLQKSQFTRECYRFADFIRDPSRTGIITEFKRRSPSKGWINIDADVERVTRGYASFGASAISVLTDTHFFGGSLDDLEKARLNEVPLLRKDFIIDEYQLFEAKAAGADVVLLIAACLSASEVRHLAHTARNLGLNVLLEIHDKEELDHVGEHVDVVGINNRNLKTFDVDIEQSIRLAEQLPSMCKISESGIENMETVRHLTRAGFDGFLIGERFMREVHPALAFKNFLKERSENKGVRNDVR